ncbi:hypothetical protein [Chryseobacterium wangxinyae]|uniref:hypothetical protein n=1 Tax=Chryseobacterium sp. CY353 TaxID=2997334 RepID=UPI00226E8891|nr:hypothetical protein [Chryseobacterium sp. CY353]MCY0970138.1 hypothetical protein [Chryseobacterium sp. CY353]
MKISNHTTIKAIAIILVFLGVVLLLSIVFIHQELVSDFLLFMIVPLVVIFFKLEVVIYELSGGWITIRKTHPFTFKKFIAPEIELPENSIRDYNFIHNPLQESLVLDMQRSDRKFAIKIQLLGFSHQQREKISSSLLSVVSQNNLRSV